MRCSVGRWLDLGLPEEETLDHMGALGVRRGLAELLLAIERGEVTGDIEEDERPAGALDRFFNDEEPNAN